jgi:predicted ATPase
MAYFRNRFRIEGLYLLDEPENAFSPCRQLELARLLSEAAAQGRAQFIVCTHSPLLMSVSGARIFSFDGEAIGPFPLLLALVHVFPVHLFHAIRTESVGEIRFGVFRNI